MFTRDVKSFGTAYDFLKGIDSIFFLYVFFPLLSFSIAYLAQNNKKTGIAPSKEWSIEICLTIVFLAILWVIWEFYTYYKNLKKKLVSTKTYEVEVTEEITEEYYNEEEEEMIERVRIITKQKSIKDIRGLLVKFREISIKLYQKHCLLSLIIVGLFAYTNLPVFGYVYGILVIIISVEKPTIPRLTKKLNLNKIERDKVIDGEELL